MYLVRRLSLDSQRSTQWHNDNASPLRGRAAANRYAAGLQLTGSPLRGRDGPAHRYAAGYGHLIRY